MTTHETPIEEQVETDEPKGLRKQLAEAHAEIKALKQEKLTGAFDALGLDPSKGLGKAIAKEYDGEPSPTALAEYAKAEYGWEPSAEENPVAGQINAAQQALDQVGQHAGSVPLPNEKDELAQAEAAGETGKAFAIKSGQVASWFGAKPGQ